MQFSFLQTLLYFVATALADVQLATPAPTTNTQFTVSWAAGSGTPALSTLKGYTLFLMVGGDTDATSAVIGPAVAGDHSTDTVDSKVFTIPAPTIGPPGALAYYMKMLSTTATGATVINYSNRFTIPGMTGAWPNPAVQAAFKTIKGASDVPPAVNQPAGAAAPPAAGAGGQPPSAGPEFLVPYSMQTTGTIKFAPMMSYPGSVITKQDTKPLYPTSHWILAQTYLPGATFVQTITAAETHTHTTKVNEAPAQTPQNDMEKFLNRWKD